MNFLQRALDEERKRIGLTKQEQAKRIGWSYYKYWKYETGEWHPMKLKNVDRAKLAKRYNLNLDDFYKAVVNEKLK